LLAHALRGFVDIDQQLSVGGLTKKGQHRDSSGGQSPISLNYNQADLFRLEIADAIDTSMVVNSCYRLSHAEQVERLLVSRRSEPCFVLLRARAIRLVSAQNKRLRQIQSQPLLGRKGPPPNGNSSSKNAVERNPFPLGETKNTPNNYSSTSLLIHERASNNTTVRLVFGRFIFRYAGA
jgi:hypothetical protein